jgi:predicted regulator of Ras-like GTPase activity (Roadblock/LC7/MglB family)
MANSNEIVTELMTEIDGAMVAAIVDGNTGMVLGSAGAGLDIDMAAAANSEVVRAKLNAMKNLGLNDRIEDILITLGKQYHIIRPTEKYEGVFIYVVLDRKGNLGMARRQVLVLEGKLVL